MLHFICQPLGYHVLSFGIESSPTHYGAEPITMKGVELGRVRYLRTVDIIWIFCFDILLSRKTDITRFMTFSVFTHESLQCTNNITTDDISIYGIKNAGLIKKSSLSDPNSQPAYFTG